jgi:CcmD family protein
VVVHSARANPRGPFGTGGGRSYQAGSRVGRFEAVLNVMENLSWLFWGYAAGWLLIFAFLFRISQKELTLRRKISELQETIEERWKQKKV